MIDDDLIEIDPNDCQFDHRLARAREIWISHADKSEMNDAERLKLILVLIDLQMSYVIDVGLEAEGRFSGHYIAYLSMLLSVAATGYRSDTYPDILDPDDLSGFAPQPATEV